MKIRFKLCTLFVASSLQAFSQMLQTADSGGGRAPYLENAASCLSLTKTEQIKHQLKMVMDSMDLAHPPAANDKSFEKFRWPLQWAAGFSGTSFYGISNFLDHNGTFGLLQDYNCGTRTYDLSNYNHQGTDIFLWPASWRMMAEGQVDIVAAAKGVIISKADGFADQNCAFGNADWNAVYVRHGDNTVAWYGHMKKFSLTPKAVGDSVQEGEYLGKVGSSGSSTGPHLHFEVYQNGSTLIDPWNGNCNSTSTLWRNQNSYYDPNLILSQSAAGEPQYPTCPQLEDLRKKTAFMQGETAYLTNYYRDLRPGDTTTYWIYSASNQILYNHFTVHDLQGAAHWAAAYWFWSTPIPLNYPTGYYRYVSRYKGKYSTAPFTIGNIEVLKNSSAQNARIQVLPGRILSVESTVAIRSLSLTDIHGRALCTLVVGNTKAEIPLTAYERALYFVRIETESGPVCGKIFLD